MILRSLAYALEKWETLGAASGFPIPETEWHVTDYYKNIKEKAVDVPGCYADETWKIGQKRHLEEVDDESDAGPVAGRKLDGEDHWPARICNLPLNGRSLWGPRINPMESSLLSIMKKNKFGDVDPGMKDNSYMQGPIYNPPDVPAPWTRPVSTEPFAPLVGASRHLASDDEQQPEKQKRQLRGVDDGPRVTHRILAESEIEPGLGIAVNWGK